MPLLQHRELYPILRNDFGDLVKSGGKRALRGLHVGAQNVATPRSNPPLASLADAPGSPAHPWVRASSVENTSHPRRL